MASVFIDETMLRFSRELHFGGVVCDARSNSAELLSLLSQLSVSEANFGLNRFRMRVVVNESSGEAIGKPHFRGMHHLVTASFGERNVFVFDILRRTISASISVEAAREIRFWKEKLFPISLGILGAAVGVVPMHCACLESGGDGLLVAGSSGAGKSTLSVALAQNGFNYVSDDWTYMSRLDGSLVAHGTAAPVKLLPDAANHFPSLKSQSLQTSMNGELAYELNIAETFNAHVEKTCEPRWLVFLERITQPRVEFDSVPSSKARLYLTSSVERLPSQLSEAAARRDLVIESVSRLPCWLLRYGESPQLVAKHLRQFVADRKREAFA